MAQSDLSRGYIFEGLGGRAGNGLTRAKGEKAAGAASLATTVFELGVN